MTLCVYMYVMFYVYVYVNIRHVLYLCICVCMYVVFCAKNIFRCEVLKKSKNQKKCLKKMVLKISKNIQTSIKNIF